MPASGSPSAPQVSTVFEMEVPFFDVDSMDIVWHGHYAKYLELARCQLLDKIHYNYRDMKASGFAFPIVDMQIKYIKPLSFGQKIHILASIVEWEYRLKIQYLIRDACSQEKLTKATTVQATVNTQTRELRLECPPILLEKMKLATQ